MKPAIVLAFGVLLPLEPAFFDEQGMPRENMGINTNIPLGMADLVASSPEIRGIVPEDSSITAMYCYLCGQGHHMLIKAPHLLKSHDIPNK
jgi:hypothetical protein